VLRAWERRYHVVGPSRSDGGQRLYSDDDVRRLTLLRRAVEEGRAISSVAGLSLEELARLVQEDESERRLAPSSSALVGSSAADLLEEAMREVVQMDPAGLERLLARGAMTIPVSALLDEVLLPLLVRIGSSWREGRLGPAHEHLASVAIRRFLEWLLQTVGGGAVGPLLVSGTPSGEQHELGALMAAVSGAAEGWVSVYLGPDLPAAEIAAAATSLQARVVSLSCVDPVNAGRLPAEVRDLRSRLPQRARLILGGAVSAAHRVDLEAEGIEVIGSLAGFRHRLRGLSEAD
jgi:DNA-binding transcriptional MerR regulator